jgi:hypothetical protein
MVMLHTGLPDYMLQYERKDGRYADPPIQLIIKTHASNH